MRGLIRRVISRFRPPSPPPAMWSGVYKSFEDIPKTIAIFNNEEALLSAEHALRETDRDPMPPEAEIDHQILALVARLLDAKEIRIDDFGGGVGQSYAAIRRMIPREVALKYRVIDLPEVVARGRRVWAERADIEFRTDPPTETPHIVFAKGFLQYFSDFRGTLRSLFAAGAPWVLLEKLSIVDAPTYATVQSAYGGYAPYWMMNASDLEEIARAANYRLVLRRRLERTYDQSAFEPALRMDRASSMLFERIPQ